MSSQVSSQALTPSSIYARLDRLTVWALPSIFVAVIGIGFMFTFYDIFDINVSFIQTCSAIVPGCTPENSNNYLGLPVVLNLAGYVVGTLILSPLSDRIGRRHMLLITMLITGIGSLLTGLVDNYTWFVIGRTLTGIGIGADLSIVNTYIGEVAPRHGRAKYTSLIFIMSAVGAFLGIWLGLLLTTGPTPFPMGLPFALAGPHFAFGWRVMYFIGALLALVGILVRFQLPESPRWLLSKSRVDEADLVVRNMEAIASKHGPLLDPVDQGEAEAVQKSMPYKEIFGNKVYVVRTFLLLGVWVFSYVTVYSYASGFTSFLTSLKYAPPEAGLIAAFGTLGFIACALFATWLGDRMERKFWLPLATLVTILGGVLVAAGGGHNLAVEIIGSMVLFFGFNVWVPITYAWSAELYPSRARTTGFGLVDGIGHLGGGVGVMVIAPMIPTIGITKALLLVNAFMVVGAIIALFGIRTKGRKLEELSP
ncbi:MFS transporter [Alicyclobacillus cycloheptanicus]|uniref:MFS family permease n=1 Tax=Alicyclobacillus cycloheptanicus TaxID=1457 RepID=A0ABT9XJ00_9BACL|nr:MFS transporter [Alicyclobacillus cycloheptanicus]MDQ0190258.1 MFS family permease [Alicyclobacillus cycloheptanicus]